MKLKLACKISLCLFACNMPDAHFPMLLSAFQRWRKISIKGIFSYLQMAEARSQGLVGVVKNERSFLC